MLQACIEGRKTVTRRLMKPQPEDVVDGTPFVLVDHGKYIETRIIKPKYLPGEVVYVKETWYCENENTAQDIMSRGEGLYYKQAEEHPEIFPKWRSPLIMPSWAARYWIRIKSVRVERIQEITNQEIRREGAASFGCTTHRLNFQIMWDSIYPGSWERNDWVFVYEFEWLDKLP